VLCEYVRATEDVDILVQADRANVERLLECLQGFGKGAAGELDPEDFTLEEGAIRVIEDFPLDIFTQMSEIHKVVGLRQSAKQLLNTPHSTKPAYAQPHR
jgi:hypothetical protein